MAPLPFADSNSEIAQWGAETEPEDLIELISSGDAISFATLYDQFASRVYREARQVLRDPAQAEEVAQEAFIEIWTKADSFDRNRGSASSWIMTITHRKAVDRVRHCQKSRDRDHLHSTSNFERDFDTVHDNVCERMDFTISRSHLEGAIEQLTFLQQQVIRLAFYDGHPYPAISRQLGIPLPTVKTRIRDGLIRLGKHYRELAS